MLVEEHPERERIALEILGSLLTSRGHEVLLSHTFAIESDYRRFLPDLVVDNVSDSLGHYMGKLSMLTKRQRNINLVWEQMFNPLSLFRFRLDDEVASRLVDGRIAWGDAGRRILQMENPKIDHTRLRACGSIKHAVHDFYAGLEPQALMNLYPFPFHQFERRVLLIDSFPAAHWDLDALREMRGDLPLCYGFEACQYISDLKNKVLSFYEYIAAKHPKWLFILRLHPTKVVGYEREFASFAAMPNVVVNWEGSIDPLIRLADLVIAARSGALVDAYFANVPGLNLALDRHATRAAGITLTAEERFAQTLPLDDGWVQSLEPFLEPASLPERDAWANDWFSSRGIRTFHSVIAFLEEIAERPALPKQPSIRSLLDARVVNRLTRHRLRLLGLKRRRGSVRIDSFDYSALRDLLLEEVKDCKDSDTHGLPAH